MDCHEVDITTQNAPPTVRPTTPDFAAGDTMADQALRDDDEDKIASIGETCCFLLFSSIFVMILLNQLTTSSAYLMTATVRNLLIDTDYDDLNFEDINSHDDMRDWLLTRFVPTLDIPQSYHGMPNYEEDELPRFGWFSRLLTPVRFFQKRVSTTENPSSRSKDLYPEIWEVSEISIDEKDADGEYTDDIERESGDLCQGLSNSVFEYDSNQGFDHAGGYQFILNVKSEQESATACASLLLDTYKWLDTPTAALGIDFVLYNAHYDFLTYVSIVVEFTAAGEVDKTLTARSIKTDYYWTFVDFFRAALELMYVCLVLYYTFIEVFELKDEFETDCRNTEFARRRENHELFTGSAEMPETKLNVLDKTKIFFLTTIVNHLKDTWNLLDVSSLVLSYVAIFIWINVLMKMPGNDVTPDEDFIEDTHQAVNALMTYVRVNAINLLLIFFRVIKYLRSFERVRLLQHTFQRAGGEIFYFFILLAVIFFGFAFFSLMAFGNTNENYSSVLDSVTSNLLLLLNSMDTTVELLDSDFIAASIYIFIFTLLINFILTNMFIAIISTAYGDKLEEFYEKKATQKAVDNVHICAKVKQHLIDLALRVAGKCCKKRSLKRKYKKQLQDLQEQHDDKNVRVENCELEYVQVKQWSTDINPEILSDKEKHVKVAEKTQALSRQLCSGLIFVVFALVYIIVLVQQQDVPQKFALTTTLRQAVQSVDYATNLQLDDIVSFSTNARWLEQGFEESIDVQNELAYIRGNYVVGQALVSADLCTNPEGPLRLTVRRVDVDENPSDTYTEYQDVTRGATFGPAEFSFDERDDTLLLTLCEWRHQDNSGFLEAGGYVFHFQTSHFGEHLGDLIDNDKFLNDTINSVTVSYVVFNGELTYFSYAGLSFIYDSSGIIDQEHYVVPMLFKLYEATPGNVIRAFFECLFVVLLIYHITLSGKTIYKDYKNYEYWRRRFYGILTAEQIQKRNRAKPEWLRRITNILTPYVLVDLFSYTCSIVCISYWLMYMTGAATRTELPVTTGDFHDEFGSQAETLSTYLNWSAFNVFFLFIRILNYLTIKKGLRFLQDTINRSMSDIIYFLLMLLIILTGYVFMSYLAFGHALANYSSIADSYMACFSIIIGEFDYSELKDVDLFMSFLFFFTLAILATYILLNIFIAILERAFNMVKEQAGRAQETTYISFFLGLLKKSVVQIFKRPQSDIKERLNAELAAEIFKRIDTGDDDQGYPVNWGTQMADELLMERTKRGEVFQPLEDLFSKRKEKEIEDIQLLFKDRSELADELDARFAYWNYLRVGMLKLSRQHAKLEARREEIARQKQRLMPEYEAQKESIEDYKQQISTNQLDLDEKKTKASLSKPQNR